jgi:PAS domain S-box-containing protein
MIVQEMQVIGLYPLVCILISVVHLCVGISILLNSPHNRANQALFLAIMSMVLWVLFHSINAALWSLPDVLIITAKLAYAAGMLTTGTVAAFCVIFSSRGALPRRILASMSTICGVFIFVSFVPGAILKEFQVTEAGLIAVHGPLQIPFYIVEAVLFGCGLWYLWRCYRTTEFDEERFQVLLLGIGIAIPVFVSLFTLGILVHFVKNTHFLSCLGPISSIVFIVLSAYAISRRGFFAEMDLALEYLFNSISAGICVTQTNGRIIRHNEKLIEILNHEESLAGQSIDDIAGFLESKAEDKESFPRQWFNEAEPNSVEIVLANPEGKTLDLAANKLVNNKGKILGKAILFHDITERNRAEAALKESFSLINATLESTVDGILVTDSGGNIQKYNRKFLEMWGIPETINKSDESIEIRRCMLNQVKYPEKAFNEAAEAYKNPDIEGFGVMELKDGRIFETYWSPQKIEGRTVGAVTSWRDVTQRRKAEEALRESEDRYRTLVDNSLTAICLIQDSEVQFVNNKFVEISGYARAELIDTPVIDLVYPDDREFFTKIAAERLAGKNPGKRYQYRVVNKNGKVFWVEVFGTLVEHQGKPAILANLMDVTHRKLAEEALKESEERYRTVVEEARDIICTIDIKTGIVTSANSYGEQVLGYSLQDVVNKMAFPDLVHPDDRGMMLQRLRGLAFEKTRELNLPFRLRKADATYIEAEINGSIINDAQGNPHTYIGVIRDISEGKRVERALRDSEEKYRTLFDESKDSVFVSTPEGKFLDINAAGAEMYGYSKKELLELDPAEDLFVDQSEREAFKKKIAEDGYVKDHEFVYRRKDGQIITTLETVTAVFDENGDIVAHRGIQRDVTEEKYLQQQLIQVQKMESIGTLAGGIAHDFNNILGGILGYASFMKSKMTEDHPFFKYVDTIERTSERAAELTSQLLGFARGGKYEAATTNINGIVLDTIGILESTIDKSVEIETHLSEEQLTVEADASQLQQVLLNLCVNASDAMPGGGRLAIETSPVSLTEEYARTHVGAKPGRYVLLSVTDTGFGMDKEVQSRIFEPFYTTKEKGKGTGLGLSMAYGVIKNHGGYISVYSELGLGTTVKAYLPMSNKAERNEKSIAQAPNGRGELILVVDDEENIRNLAGEVLKSHNYDVLLAEDGAEAIEIFDQHNGSIGLVILDLVMPKMGGHETFLRMNARSPGVKVLLSTGYSQEGKAREILDSGVMGFIQKPYHPNELLSKIRSILEDES